MTTKLDTDGKTELKGKWYNTDVNNFALLKEAMAKQQAAAKIAGSGKGGSGSSSGGSGSEEKTPTVENTSNTRQTSDTTSLSATNTESASLQQGHNEGQTYSAYDQAKAKELAAPIIAMQQQAYGADKDGNIDPNYWYKMLGIYPEALKKQREADARASQARAKAAAIGQTFMAANDLFGNLIGARMPKRDKDNTAKEETEKARQLRELVAAEDAARIKDASTRQQAYSAAAAETMMKALEATKTAISKSDAENVGKQVSSQGTESSQYSDQRGWQNQKQFGTDGKYNVVAQTYRDLLEQYEDMGEVNKRMENAYGSNWRSLMISSNAATAGKRPY